MTEKERLEEIRKIVKEMDSSAKVFIKEDSLLMKLISHAMSKNFMIKYSTTLCNRLYLLRKHLYGDRKDLLRLLAHEILGHVKQCRTCGFGIHPWVGFPIFAILYGVIIFPIKLAVFRYFFEKNAESKSWRYSLKNGLMLPVEVYLRAKSFAEKVASKDYYYTLAKSWVINGFKKEADKVVKEFEGKK